MKIKYGKEYLEEQRDYILSEMDYHKILNFTGDLVGNDKRLKFIDYTDATAVREELKGVIDDFIERYFEENGELLSVYHNGKWHIGFTYDHDGGTPYLEASFKYEVTEQDGFNPRNKKVES